MNQCLKSKYFKNEARYERAVKGLSAYFYYLRHVKIILCLVNFTILALFRHPSFDNFCHDWLACPVHFGHTLTSKYHRNMLSFQSI